MKSATARGTGRARKVPARVRSGDVLLVTLAGAIILIAFNFTPSQIFGFLYQPVSGLIALLVIVEFLWLKSADRTRIYRLEIERLRNLRNRDEELLKLCRAVLKADPQENRSGEAADLLTKLDERL